jgi:alkylation response protein AidB-like acyl-CoA dehydrogenase
MDFTYTEDQLAVRDMMERFTRKELAPIAADIDRTSEFPYEVYRKLGELGIIGMTLPVEAGGSGSDFLSFCLAVEELARADSLFGPTLTAQLSACRYILTFGSGEQKEKWIDEYVKPIARGLASGATASTEPNRSSFDTHGNQTTAVRDGDEYVINGNKTFCTSAGLENNKFVLVWAITDKETRKTDVLLVPKGTPGYRIGRKLPKMGMRGSDTRELFFEDCRVPAFNLMKVPSVGRSKEVGSLHYHSRLTSASNAIGLHRHCLEDSLSWAKDRISWGQPIAQRQLIQGWLAEMATELEISRMLRDKCAWLYDRGELTVKDASMLKYVVAENAAKAANYATEIHGGMGFMDDVPVARRFRDAKGLTVIQGGTTIHKWLIAQELGC